jgi:glycosyltransferase involved in cell wall biosynthesis
VGISSKKVERQRTIAFIGTHGLPARYGGFETFVAEISKYLSDQGWNVLVYGDQEPNDFMMTNNIICRKSYIDKGKSPVLNYAFDLWDARHCDLIYMCGSGGAIFTAFSRALRRKTIINMDGLGYERSGYSLMARLFIKSCFLFSSLFVNNLVADSPGIKSVLQNKFFRKKPVEVIAYGTHTVEAGKIEHNGRYLVVARCVRENHILEICQAFGAMSNQYLDLIINQPKTKYYELVKSVASQYPNINLIGPIYDGSKLLAYRQECMTYIHGHSVGGTNPSLLEAMACGRDIIAFDVSFNRETLRKTNFYFKGKQDLINILENKSEYGKEGRKAMGIAEDAFSWDTIGREYVQYLDRLI